MKWTQLSEINPERNYLAAAVYAERLSAWSYFSCFNRALKVQKQLRTTKGIVGFAARLEFLSRNMAQVAVYEDESALKAFAHAGQHANCIGAKESIVKWHKMVTWSILGSEIPPRLDDTIKKVLSQK